MTQIHTIGTITGIAGYDIHTRNLINAIDKIIPVRLTTNIFQGQEQQLTDRELQMLKRKQVKDEINLMITLPNQWKLYTTNKRNWGFCVWEGDKVPESWIEECFSLGGSFGYNLSNKFIFNDHIH